MRSTFSLVAVLIAPPMFAATCESLASSTLPDTTITMAQVIAAGQFVQPGAGQAKGKGATAYK
ncbi:MAG: hypothetical protein JO307_27190, partial [Bryobacterales bacterium]|nr:hypothetical protein [Bryobacterales bacterium]